MVTISPEPTDRTPDPSRRDQSTEKAPCPTCGPTTLEQHPRRPGVTRCVNCKEWLPTAEKAQVRCPVSDTVLHPVCEPGVAEPFTWVCDMECATCECDDEWCGCYTELGVFGDPMIYALLTTIPPGSAGA